MSEQESSVSGPPVDPTPAPAPVAPGGSPGPLDQVPLGEYMARRAKGERPGVVAATAALAPAASEPVTPPGAGSPEAPADGEAPPSKQQQKSDFQKRLGELTAQKRDYQFIADTLRAKLESAEAELAKYRGGNGQAQPQAQPGQPPAPPPVPQAPPKLQARLDAGGSYEDWVVEVAQWAFLAGAPHLFQAWQQQQQQQEGQRQLHDAMSTFQSRLEAVRATVPDFDAVVANNSEVQLSPVMQDVALRSERGAEIMYWLGKNPRVANELGEMTMGYPPAAFPLVEAHLLSRLSDANGSSGASAPAPSLSSAPAPITPLGGGSATVAPRLDQLPLGDYMKIREAEWAKKRGRP